MTGRPPRNVLEPPAFRATAGRRNTQLVTHASGQGAPGPHPVRPPAKDPPSAALAEAWRSSQAAGFMRLQWTLALTTPLGLGLVFILAHSAIDAPTPAVENARLLYVAVAGVGLAVVGTLTWLAWRTKPWTALGALAGLGLTPFLYDLSKRVGGYGCDRVRGAPDAGLLPQSFAYTCNKAADIEGVVFGIILSCLFVATVVAAAIQVGGQRPWGGAIIGTMGSALALAMAAAAIWAIPNLPEVAERAALANRPRSIPGVELVVLALALLGAVAWKRRRRRSR